MSTLVGFAGNDAMAGGLGNDTYIVDSTKDVVTEVVDTSFNRDTVESSIATYTLGANFENLVLSSGAVNGTGNSLDNQIIGNSADNKLDGAAGNDELQGNNGNDNLIGQAGQDNLYGGAGNDTISGGADIDFIDGGFGDDVLSGGADQDLFAIGTTAALDLPLLGNDTINGFQTGLDRIFMSDLLEGFNIDPADAFSGGYILLTPSGPDTLIQFDKDGSAGGAVAVALATVTNATVAVSDIEPGSI